MAVDEEVRLATFVIGVAYAEPDEDRAVGLIAAVSRDLDLLTGARDLIGGMFLDSGDDDLALRDRAMRLVERVGAETGGRTTAGSRAGRAAEEDVDELQVADGGEGEFRERARLRHWRQEAVESERERLAEVLTSGVLNPILEVVFDLEGLAHRLAPHPEVAARVQRAADTLDDTLRRIRGALYPAGEELADPAADLPAPSRADPHLLEGLRSR